jgi:hypothetical protein
MFSLSQEFGYVKIGSFISGGSPIQFGKRLVNLQTYTIGFMVDLHLGNLRIFIDGEDMGFAVQDNFILKNMSFYLTCATYD